MGVQIPPGVPTNPLQLLGFCRLGRDWSRSCFVLEELKRPEADVPGSPCWSLHRRTGVTWRSKRPPNIAALGSPLSNITPDLSGAVSIVIGGAEGIGAEIALGLAAVGSEVVVSSRSIDRLESVSRRLEEAGARFGLETVDVRDPAAVESFGARVMERFGTPTVLVNSMGGGLVKPALDVLPSEWDALHETHLRGAFLTSQTFARAMRVVGYGKIVNMSSTWAFTAAEGRSVYATAKGGLSRLTAALAVEWAQYGIRVNSVAPTTTRTPRIEKMLEDDPTMLARAESRIPLGRLATPDDVVGSVIFLASAMSDFVTGQTLLVDGGMVASR